MPMLPVPVLILKRFDAILEKRAVAPIQRADYKKWLRYFLDFCTKYPVPEARPDQVRLFIDKLREKRQTLFQQNQAAHAVSLFFEMQRKRETPVADFNTDTTTSFIPEPLQVREKNKPPKSLSSKDVKEYLTYLAVQCRVSASTQNQAFNALLFLFRHALKHFEAGILTVHGKGKKDRTVPLPETIVPELTSQLEVVKNIHDEDLAAGYAGVFLDDRLEKKYPSAAKDFIWQWFFPQKTLTQVSAAQELRRYHLHETHVQDALYEAVRRAKLTKRVTSHTFRHTALPLIFCRPITISGRSRHYSATVT